MEVEEEDGEDDPVWNINGVKPLKKLKDQEFVEVEGSGSSKYKVKRINDHYSCTCPAWAFLKGINVDCRSCKHCKAVLGEEYEKVRLEAKGVEVPTSPVKGKGKRKAADSDSPSKKKKKTNDDGDDDDDSVTVQVLLANKFDLEGKQDPTGWWISEKLDGLRCFWDGKSKLLSRLGNKFAAPDWFKEQLPQGTTLDGELWHSRGGFNEATSIVRSGASKRWNEIRFHVFDVPSEGSLSFEERVAFLEKTFHNSPSVAAPVPVDEDDEESQMTHEIIGKGTGLVDIHDESEQGNKTKKAGVVDLVQHTKCEGKDHLLRALKRVEQLGGEGLMLRKPGSKYEGRRSSTLLKVKTFYEADAEVIGHVNGKGKYAGMTGSLKCKMESGQEFQVGSGMNDDLRKKPPKIGTIINYRFQEITKDGVPRFPTFLGIRIDMKKPKDYVFPAKKSSNQKNDDSD
ncbi:DNA ligase/mRNA capping enzyme [Atractiella rhizophila]|nr:DNA ligase/mRNA capping enzyme [Atractiella rhizophila]